MAKRETITYIQENILSGGFEEVKEPCLNVSGSVGEAGENDKGDVMLIQAMFQYIVHSAWNWDSKTMLFRAMLNPIPEPTGDFDTPTKKAIKVYQQIHARGLLRVDGLIHPADYTGRRIKLGTFRNPARLMTITLLHFSLKSSLLGGDYTTDIKQRFPQLNPFI